MSTKSLLVAGVRKAQACSEQFWARLPQGSCCIFGTISSVSILISGPPCFFLHTNVNFCCRRLLLAAGDADPQTDLLPLSSQPLPGPMENSHGRI